jgi:hypothetical protein
MLARQINLHVSTDFVIPEVYTKGTLEEIEEALWIGASIQQSVRTRRGGEEAKKITELKDAEIERIQTMYTEKLTKLLDDIRSVTLEKDKIGTEFAEGLKDARGKEREAVGREWEEKMRALRREYEVLQGRHAELEARRRTLEEGRTRDIEDAVKRTEELMEKLVTSKQEQLTKMEAAYGRLNETIGRQSEEITKLSSVLGKRGANVKQKGSDYEEEFGEKLRRSYGLCRGFQIKDTRLGMGHEMDFSMEMDGHVVMWELKNYSASVPKAEVEKFLRDLKENPQAKIGVMLSRVTDIIGKNGGGHMLTEFDGDKMMIYINKFEEFCGEDENRVFQMLGSLFRIWWEYHREETNTFDRAEMVRELEKAVEEIAKRRTDWRRHKAHLDEIGRWTADLLDESEGRLDRLLKKARNSEDSGTGVERPLVIPEGVFRDSGEEKEVAWIKSIMKVCEPGGEIEVRELVDLLGAHHRLSKDTIRSNVMSIIRDVAVVKKGVVKYIRGISKFVPPSQIKIGGGGQ